MERPVPPDSRGSRIRTLNIYIYVCFSQTGDHTRATAGYAGGRTAGADGSCGLL